MHHHYLLPSLGMHEANSSTLHRLMTFTGTFTSHTQDKRIKCLMSKSEDQNYTFFMLLLRSHWWNTTPKNHICTLARTDCIFQTRRLIQRCVTNTAYVSYLQDEGSLGCVINTTMHNGSEATWGLQILQI